MSLLTRTSHGTNTAPVKLAALDVDALVEKARDREARDLAGLAFEYISSANKAFHEAWRVERDPDLPEWERCVARDDALSAAHTLLVAARRMAFQSEQTLGAYRIEL